MAKRRKTSALKTSALPLELVSVIQRNLILCLKREKIRKPTHRPPEGKATSGKCYTLPSLKLRNLFYCTSTYILYVA